MTHDPTTQTLDQLGVTADSQVENCFEEVRQRFDSQTSGVPRDEVDWRTKRDAWLGRKGGVLTRITENWLKAAAPSLRPKVGRCVNELRSHVERRLDELQKALEKAAETAAFFGTSDSGPDQTCIAFATSAA